MSVCLRGRDAEQLERAKLCACGGGENSGEMIAPEAHDIAGEGGEIAHQGVEAVHREGFALCGLGVCAGGLALCRRLARTARGEVRAEPSEAGARFTVRLPAA